MGRRHGQFRRTGQVTDVRIEQIKRAGAFAPALFHIRCPEGAYFITSVPIRFGTSPTGMTAVILRVLVSIAVTDFRPELEM